MKETDMLSGLRSESFFRFGVIRKNIACFTLTGTAALATFLAAAAAQPAQAARHSGHHSHHSQHGRRSVDEASASTPSHHHHRHHEDDQTASEPRHHHHSRHDDEAQSEPTRHNRHHQENIASSETSHHSHRTHHISAHEENVARAHTRHEERLAQLESHHSRRHSHDSARANTSHAYQEHLARWNAHVARYEERMASLHGRRELRYASMEAHEANVSEANEALRSGNLVRAAEAFRGTRYVMGGTSRSGFDCSGFVRFILGQAAGVSLPRTAEEQYYEGTPVDKSDLQAGDLVFFKNTYRSGISHVGMYVGDGRFVHACNPSKGVTVDNLSEGYYMNHWAGARRVIQNRLTGEM